MSYIYFETQNAIAKIESVQNKTLENIKDAMSKVCMKIQRTCVEEMTNTTTNDAVNYYTHNQSIPHHPSMPNNPPAVDTGTLRRSITFKIEEERDTVVGKVGSTLNNPPYPQFLEYGTSKMQPRPWLRPAVKTNEDFIRNTLKNAIKNGVSK